MKSIEDRIRVCRHHRGQAIYSDCGKGRIYDEVSRKEELGLTGCMIRLPCIGNEPGTIIRGHTVESCDLYEPHTKEEIEAEDKEFQRTVELMKKGLSSCCEAPIDISHVITDGQHKGHGPRYCSKCKRMAYMV